MRCLLLLSAVFISTLASGQLKDSVKLRRLEIGIVFSPDYSYRLLRYPSSNMWVQDLRNGEEVATFGFTTGLSMRIDLTKDIILETGLLYSIKGDETKYKDLEWAEPNANFPIKSKIKYHYTYVDIPAKVNYFLSSRKVRFLISGGVSLNVFSEKKTIIISEFAGGHKTSERSSKDLGYLKFNLAAIFGCGLNYDLTKRISISVEPVYRQFINSIAVDKNAKEYPYSIGATVGLYFSFKENTTNRLE